MFLRFEITTYAIGIRFASKQIEPTTNSTTMNQIILHVQ